MKKNIKILSLKETQEEEKKILQIVITLLDKLNIEYYLCYGSLLGAVRHKGFIPWDDDIDLVMFRTEYNKFLNYLNENKNKINDDISAIGWELGNSEWPFIKIINKNILVDTPSKNEKNLWIDIFPLDNVPNNDFFFYKKIFFYRKLMMWKTIEMYTLKIERKNSFVFFLKKIFIYKIMHLIKYDNIIKKFIINCKKYNNVKCEYMFNNVWGVKYMNKIPKSTLKSIYQYKFEDINVKSFKDYDTVLKACYGNNYMTPPPKEKRVTHEVKAYKIK